MKLRACKWNKRISDLTSYCALLKLMELALDESKHKAGLAHSWLSQQDQFELADLIARVGPVGPGRSSPIGHDSGQCPLLLLAHSRTHCSSNSYKDFRKWRNENFHTDHWRPGFSIRVLRPVKFWKAKSGVHFALMKMEMYLLWYSLRKTWVKLF